MANVLRSSVKTAAMPERAYDMARRPVSASRRGKQHRRRSPVLPILLALLLFGGGFLLGKSSAAILPGEILPGGDTPVTTVPMEELKVPMEDVTVPSEESQAPVEEPVVTPEPVIPEAPAVPQEPVIPEEPAVPAEAEAPWNLRLISAAHPLPEDFTVPELTQLRNNQAIDTRVYPALQQMMDDARAAGLQPLICSSYRTRATQERLFQNKIDRLVKQGYSREEAELLAAEWVARPGTSEHEAGLAVDIVDTNYQILDEQQEQTPVQQWLMAHCADYGFILRYPLDKSDLTSIGYEPWHYRYVGEEAAKEIMEQGICLEEHLES